MYKKLHDLTYLSLRTTPSMQAPNSTTQDMSGETLLGKVLLEISDTNIMRAYKRLYKSHQSALPDPHSFCSKDLGYTQWMWC